jgi:hypothetical protein
MKTDQDFGERFVRLALAIDEHQPGYVDAFFDPEEWRSAAKEHGKRSLTDLANQVNDFATQLAKVEGMDAQRKDYLARHLTAMQMSLRLISGEEIPFIEEVEALYDIHPTWKDELYFEEAHKLLDELLPSGDSIQERMIAFRQSLGISVEKAKEVLPTVIQELRTRARQRFDLPTGEDFQLEFVSDQPWSAYNWYLGNSKSRIEINTDRPLRITGLPDLIAHEGYPGHHTDLCIKEETLVNGLKYYEFTVNLLNAPSAVMAEGIATRALETILTEQELEDWYRDELLPLAGLSHMDPKRIGAISQAARKMGETAANAAFMMHEQHKGEEEISQYLQRYGLQTEKGAKQMIRFISVPFNHSYVFTYDTGYELLAELFEHGNRDRYFKRLIEEPVTPTLVKQWIANHNSSPAN